MVLHRHEPHPPVGLGRILRLGKLPGPHAGRPDITHFARFDEIVQGFHGLLDGCLVVPAVDLIQIDVVDSQTLERSLDRRKDVLARQSAGVRRLRCWTGEAALEGEIHRKEHFGGNHRFVPAGKLPQELAGQLL